MIRKAEKKDCKAMMDLIHELAIFEKAGDEVVLTLDQFIEDGFGDKPVWGAFVAEIDGGIVGMSLYYDRYSTWKGRRLYLEDLVVTEKCVEKTLENNYLTPLWNTEKPMDIPGWFFKF